VAVVGGVVDAGEAHFGAEVRQGPTGDHAYQVFFGQNRQHALGLPGQLGQSRVGGKRGQGTIEI
jgi:hypothetical protein